MKIRTDFVTNSSSSSFILGFKSEDTWKKELAEGFPDWAVEYFAKVETDLNNDLPLTKKEILDEAKEELKWSVRWEAEAQCRYSGPYHSYTEVFEWLDSEEGKRAQKELLNQRLDELQKKMQGNDYFLSVNYGDHDTIGSKLEHEVMPQVENVIQIYDHH